MTYSDSTAASHFDRSPHSRSTFVDSQRPPSPRDERPVAEGEVVPGRILWLPSREDLPAKAVRRAHGKGAVEEGIYNHPIVVISRPAEDRHMAHFHLITSFQGKRLHEIYGKSNEFHTSRRSWYLPIAPTPAHPDATSKKAKKRFPTLDLAKGAVLRWDSYVNLRHVYKVDISNLGPYANPDAPDVLDFRLERESMIRLLSKSRFLTGYETGKQLDGLERQAECSPTQPREWLIPERDRSTSPPSPDPESSPTRSKPTDLTPLIEHPFLGEPNNEQGQETETEPELDRGEQQRKTMSRWEMVRRFFQVVLGWPWSILKRLQLWLSAR
ncbi:hypothetical protein EJ04DRAFT_489940 [Polyplosphaeria fusca]|uniref:Uncharacterized protein n=1 Tax=Polyplosphaeria fusca TaxID=682080 RepID=A0A9P4R0N4_9PLEO|nr:hypothetical protein EJ04DRAFT_489940 [Polyplosphaeria fusca]